MRMLAAVTIMGWLVIVALAVMAFDLALALLTNPFDIGLFAACVLLVAAAHTAIVRLRRRRG